MLPCPPGRKRRTEDLATFVSFLVVSGIETREKGPVRADGLACERYGILRHGFWRMCRYVGISVYRYIGMTVCRYFGMSVYRYMDMSICRYIDMSVDSVRSVGILFLSVSEPTKKTHNETPCNLAVEF